MPAARLKSARTGSRRGHTPCWAWTARLMPCSPAREGDLAARALQAELNEVGACLKGGDKLPLAVDVDEAREVNLGVRQLEQEAQAGNDPSGRRR